MVRPAVQQRHGSAADLRRRILPTPAHAGRGDHRGAAGPEQPDRAVYRRGGPFPSIGGRPAVLSVLRAHARAPAAVRRRPVRPRIGKRRLRRLHGGNGLVGRRDPGRAETPGSSGEHTVHLHLRQRIARRPRSQQRAASRTQGDDLGRRHACALHPELAGNNPSGTGFGRAVRIHGFLTDTRRP